MSAWTTLEMAKKQVGIPQADCANDDWLRLQLRISQAMCLQFLNTLLAADPDPTPEDFSVRERELIRGAMYLQFAEVWRFRGDDTDGEAPKSNIPGTLAVQVERCLLQLRAPSIA